MWQDDIVTFQTGVKTNVNGSISTAWTDATTVACDVQDINRDFVFKRYGITGAGEYKQVFDHTQSALWVKGNQVKFGGIQWWVKMVNGNMGKMGASNHTYVILNEVI